MKREVSVEKCISTAGGNIYYQYISSFPGRPTVVLLHGLSSNHTTWNVIREELYIKGYNSLAVDLRGHARSDKRKVHRFYRWSTFTDDLHQILEQEQLERPILVGYSYGGPIALNYAATYPNAVEAMVIISTNYVNPLEYARLGFLAPLCYCALQVAGWLLTWQRRKEYIYFQQEKSGGYLQSVWIGLNTMPLSINMWMLSQMFILNLKSVLPKISAATLVVRGEKDPFVSAAEMGDMVRLLPNGELQTTHYTGHFVASRAQHELSDLITNFTEAHEHRTL